MFPSMRGVVAASANLSFRVAVLASLSFTLTGCSGMFTQVEDPQQSGLRLYGEKSYAEAAGSFRNAVKNDPRDYKSRYLLAVSQDAMGAYQEAVESYKTTLDTMNVTMIGRADAEFRLKVLDGLAVTVAKSDPHDTQLNAVENQARTTQKAEDFFLLAKVYRYRGDADMAMENYQHATLLDNRYFPLLKESGLYLEQLQQQQRALPVLEQAYRIRQDDKDIDAALRRMGIIPGPSLREKGQLAEPLIPRGPIPPVDMNKLKNAITGTDNSAQRLPTPAASIQAPRE